MEDSSHYIHLLLSAQPRACNTPAPVAKHWEAAVKRQLDEDERRGVITPVPTGEAIDWCARMVVVAKKNVHPRPAVDY